MLHIGYILKRYPRLSETFIVNEMTELRRQGVKVSILALGNPGESVIHDKVRALDAAVYYVSKDARQSVAQLGQLGVQHLHAHFASGATTFARALSQHAGLPFSFTAHAKDIYHQSVDPDDLTAKMQAAAFVVTVTDYNRRYLENLRQQHLAAHAERLTPIIRIYNGLDLHEFQAHETLRDHNHVLGVGRLVAKKGFDVLIAACHLLRQRNPALRCTIIGEGEARTALEAQIQSLGLQDTVKLLGARAQHEVIATMRQAGVFALPCLIDAEGNMDALPTVLLEAMALGTPVISTAINGIPEMIQDQISGMLVPERDPAALAHAIDHVLSHRTVRRQLTTNAQDHIRQHFDASVNVGMLKALFNQHARSA